MDAKDRKERRACAKNPRRKIVNLYSEICTAKSVQRNLYSEIRTANARVVGGGVCQAREIAQKVLHENARCDTSRSCTKAVQKTRSFYATVTHFLCVEVPMIGRNIVMRVARPTDHLDVITEMYCKGLGFSLIGSFQNHDGFSGAILGHPQHLYHLEFTHQTGHTVGKAPTEDHLLVFYISNREEWQKSCQQMLQAGFMHVPAYNPYWEQAGTTFMDVDGYRIVLQNRAWEG